MKLGAGMGERDVVELLPRKLGGRCPPKTGENADLALDGFGVGEKASGESSVSCSCSCSFENDMDELKDWSTSMGKSVSVRVGEGTGEENRLEGKDSFRGEEEKASMLSGV